MSQWTARAATLLVALLVAGAVSRGLLPAVAGVAVVVLLGFVAHAWPRLALVAYLLVGILPMMLRFTSARVLEDLLVVGGGVTVGDLLLVAMGIAVLVEILGPSSGRESHRRLGWAFGLFIMWALLEVARNVPMYGIAAPGEFRFRYLPIVIPAYLIVKFKTAEEREWVARRVFLLGVLVPLLALPFIGFDRGWVVGPLSRLLLPDISVGIMLGVVWGLARWYRGTKYPSGPVITGAALVALLELLVDGYRSVWLATAVTLLVLALSGQRSPQRKWAALAASTLVLALALGIVASSNPNLTGYVGERITAFTNPTEDVTSAWRLSVWKAALASVADKWPAGLGLGGYWSLYVPELEGVVTVFPHNMYVLTVVKLGAVGLVLWLGLLFETGRALVKGRSAVRYGAADIDSALIVTGTCAFFSAIAYQVAYGVVAWNLIWIGLALAALSTPAVDECVDGEEAS